MFNTWRALLKPIPCLSHGNTYLKHSHVLHMGIFVLLSQDLRDPPPPPAAGGGAAGGSEQRLGNLIDRNVLLI